MYAWGRGEHGRLGFGDDKSSKMVPQKVQLLEGHSISQVSLSHMAYNEFSSKIRSGKSTSHIWPMSSIHKMSSLSSEVGKVKQKVLSLSL